MRRLVAGLVAGLALALLAGGARAATLERVRAAGVLRCGATPHGGFAEARDDGRVVGLGVDLCRALTIVVLGPAGRTAFRLYGSARDYDSVRAGEDDVAFLDAPVVAERGLAAATIAGPVVFVSELSVLARPGADGLGGRVVCFMSGSLAHQAVEAFAARRHVAFVRSGFQEEGEMQDAFDAHRCDAMAGEAADLAAFRAEARERANAAVLPALGVVPVFAATTSGDGAWASLVGWATAAIVQSETTPSPWRGDPPGAVFPGLRPGWLADVTAALGGYDAMRDRALGGARLSALWPDGVLLPAGPR